MSPLHLYEPITKERSENPQENRPRDINSKIKQKEIENFYITSTICVGTAVILIILGSQVFTRKIFKRIIKPVF